jgi:hypothetical protein
MVGSVGGSTLLGDCFVASLLARQFVGLFGKATAAPSKWRSRWSICDIP